MLVGTPCCPPPDLICQGRPIVEDAVLEGGHLCVETVPYCNVNVDGCGGEAALPGMGLTCCPPDIGTCDICQGRPILDVVLESGYSCTETVPFCNDNAAQCQVTSCEEIEGSLGPLCCPASDASETPSDASEASSDGSETPPDESCDICQGVPLNESAVIDGGATCGDSVPYCNSNTTLCGATCADLQGAASGLRLVCCPPPPSPPCDICQGRPIIDFTLETGYTCADSVPFCVDNSAACGGTCEELQGTMGAACCPPAEDASEAGAADGPGGPPAPAPAPAPALRAPAPAPAPTEQPELPIQQATEATEEEGDGFESGAVTGASAGLTMLLVLTVSRLLC
jgi:hypothetical protein